MSYSSGVNRVFLLGRIGNEPEWRIINGQHVLCMQLSTTENIRKNGGAYQLTEWHSIKIPAELITNDAGLKPGALLFVQGKLQTRIVFENNVKLYKTEVLVTSFEKLKSAKGILEVI